MEIGSRDGHDSHEFAVAAGIDQVYIVEPSPGSYVEIKRSYPHFNVFQTALSNYEGRSRFFDVVEVDRIKRGMSSLMAREAYEELSTNSIEVPVTTGAALLESIGVDEISACKIDVEGHAYEVLLGFGTAIAKLSGLHVECELVPIWEGQKLYSDVHSVLDSAGFVRAGYWEFNDHTQCDSVWLKPSKARRKSFFRRLLKFV